VHAGSLLHDDVVDQASRRRGEPAVRLIAGDRASVLVGDVMITLAIHLLRPWGSDVVVDAVDTVTHMSRGALLETTSRGFLERSTERWRSVVAGKTGSLFAFCGKAASRLGRLRNGSDPAKSFGDCGMSLGVAFQLADDLLDLWPEDSGKDRFADLRNRECTYPIVSEAQHNAEFAKGVEALWAHETPPEKDVERLGLALMAGRGPRDTLEQISAEINASLDALAPYRSRPEGDTLARWAESMQARASDMLGTLQQAANPARRQSLG
jgi:heptaprenyl diphosphate synthase